MRGGTPRRWLSGAGLSLLLLAAGAAAAQENRRSPVVVAADRVSPAVVNIAAEATVRAPDPFFGMFFGRARRAQSLGSGLIVDPGGIVVTNAHVVEGASRIEVKTLAGESLQAEVLGLDHDADLAVLKVEAQGLPAVPLGRTDDLMIGETVIAIGNPFGLSHTVTTGVLSARGRAVPREGGATVYTDFLQTDAAINPGNSGGPLVDVEGTVIGINTAIVQAANGIGFAIPADRAARVVDDLLRFGALQPVWTGLRLTGVAAAEAREMGLAEAGVLVERVLDDSPGEAAGLRAGDLVTRVEGRRATQREDVTTAFYSVAIGEAVSLRVRRAGSGPEETVTVRPQRPPEGLGEAWLSRLLGIRVAEEGGRLVVAGVAPGSLAARRGLDRGDVILAANGRLVRDARALGNEVLRGSERGGLLLVVQRGRYRYNLGFPL